MPTKRIRKSATSRAPRESELTPNQQAPFPPRKGDWAFWMIFGCLITLIVATATFLAVIHY